MMEHSIQGAVFDSLLSRQFLVIIPGLMFLSTFCIYLEIIQASNSVRIDA